MMKNIVFDFGCVLVNLDKHRCVEALRQIGAGAISYYVDECRQEDLFHDLEIGSIGIEAFCNEVRRKSEGCKATNDEICWAWNELLSGIPRHRIERLRELKRQHRLFLLSNTNPIHWEKCRRELEGCFEQTFLSYEMHLIKPDPEIFCQMLSKAEIAAEDTLFIDDSAANCAAAASVGIATMHVTHGDEWLDKI